MQPHQQPHAQGQPGQQGQQGQPGQPNHGPPAAQLPWGSPWPSLHLWPIQDTFQMKMIHLPPGQKVKIGRQTNNKTVPGERNAYFDSKVLSRTHAEIWEQGSKIWIKDVKSSNGTFINGVRLSPEGVESEPFELKSEDMVEFGIDIISEDNRAIIHHKVSAKAYCVFGPEDNALSSREHAHYQVDPRGVRRPGPQGQGGGVNPLSQMGPAVLSAGGKMNGLSFEHVVQKLQNELSKSKETTHELQGLNKAMTDVQDTLGGGLAPGQNGTAVDFIPPQFRNPSAEAQAALAGPHGPQAAAFIALQTQMSDTQTSLNGHLDRIRQLESQLQQQEGLKQELGLVRREMEESRHEMEMLLAASRKVGPNGQRQEYDSDDDDDARSVATVMPDDGDEKEEANEPQPSASASASAEEAAKPDADLDTRVQTLTAEMEDALQLSRSLQAQHSEAMSTVKLLTDRLDLLENGIAERVTAAVERAEERWETWRTKFEERWRKERDGWETERERLRGVVREWEEASRRAVEEEEEREMNETLSDENDLADEEEEDTGHEEVEAGELLTVHERWQNGLDSPEEELDADVPRVGKSRRRRPSTKTSLAMRSLRAMANMEGASTPKASLESLPVPADVPVPRPRELRRDALHRAKRMSAREKRAASAAPGFVDKESSESGRESADTLRGDKDLSPDGKVDHHHHSKPVPNSVPIVTVIAIAAVAGILYYRSKE